MTPEELQELRDWAARKMGWFEFLCGTEWGYTDKEGVFPTGDALFMPFSKWLPDNPSTGQIWILVERMRELGFHLKFSNLDDAWWAEWWQNRKKVVEDFDLINPCLAILVAARATEG